MCTIRDIREIESPQAKRRPCGQFILLERGSDDEITPLFRRAGLTVRSKLSTWDDYAIMAMVEDGLGVSVLPALILRRCQFDVAIRPLEGHPHRQINRAARAE